MSDFKYTCILKYLRAGWIFPTNRNDCICQIVGKSNGFSRYQKTKSNKKVLLLLLLRGRVPCPGPGPGQGEQRGERAGARQGYPVLVLAGGDRVEVGWGQGRVLPSPPLPRGRTNKVKTLPSNSQSGLL